MSSNNVLFPPQALAEIADFKPPSLTASGCYTLRRERWDMFDPFFVHLGRKTAGRAWERALEVRL